MTALESLGEAARSRLASLEGARRLRRVAAWALPVLLALSLADCLLALPGEPIAWAWGILAFLLAAVWISGIAPPPPPEAALARVDLALGLRDLLSTAEQERRRHAGSGFASLLAERASAEAEGVDLARALPSSFQRRDLRWAAGYAVAALLSVLPPLGPRLRDGAGWAAAALEAAAQLGAAERKLSAAGLKDPARRVEDVRRDLERGRLSRSRALKALDALERALDKAKPSGPDASAGDMARAGSAMSSKAASELSRALRSGDPGAAAKALEKLGRDAKSMTPKERDELARDLERAGRELSKSGPLGAAGKSMEEASKALRSPSPGAAGGPLGSAAKPFGGMGAEKDKTEALDEAKGTVREGKAAIGRSGPGGAPPPSGGPPGPGAGPPGPGAGPPGPSSSGSGPAGTGPGPGSGMATPTPGGGAGGGGPSPPRRGQGNKLAPFRRVEGGGGETLTVPGQVKGGENSDPSVFKGSPDAAPSAVPYTDLLPGYKAQAEDALRKESVPPGYRKMIHDYFELLDPKSRGAAKPAGGKEAL